MIDVDRWMSQADPNSMVLKTKPVPVRAGAHRVTAAFLRTFDGPVNDNIAPIGHSHRRHADRLRARHHERRAPARHDGHGPVQPDRRLGDAEPAARSSPAVRRRLTKHGPAPRRSCRSIGGAAYRRPLQPKDVKGSDDVLRPGRARRAGSRSAFARRSRRSWPARTSSSAWRSCPAGAQARASVTRSARLDLASRLSFFLWGAPPDEALIAAARNGTLSEPDGARGADAAHARRSALGGAGDAVRRAVAAPAGHREGPSRRAAVPRLPRAARRRHAARDGAVLLQPRSREQERARSLQRELHVRERGSWRGTTASPASPGPSSGRSRIRTIAGAACSATRACSR